MSTTESNANTHNNTSRGSSAPKPTKAQVLKFKAYREVLAVRRLIADAAKSDRLTAWEQSFLASIAARFAAYGSRCRMSLAQVMTINRLLLKVAV